MSETVPLRHVFGALFFASLGMLADPGSVADEPGSLLAVIGAVIGVKFVITAGLTRIAGYMPHVAFLVGLGVIQIGEFSFVLADQAALHGIVRDDFLSIVVMAAVITMALTPAALAVGSHALDALGRRFPALRPLEALSADGRAVLAGIQDHAVVAGLGRVGTMVAGSFREQNIPFVSIDIDQRNTERWREMEYITINGSSSSPEVLEAAGIRRARLLVAATGDLASASLTAERAREMNPGLDIVARAHWREEAGRLQKIGVDEVVMPENEAGLEIIRHSLLRFQTELGEAERIVEELRDETTATATEDPDGPVIAGDIRG